MPDLPTIRDFLATRHIAVVGVSRDSTQFANSVYRALRAGRTLYPVNTHAGEVLIEGDVAYRSLADVPDPIDGVLVMVPAENAVEVVREAIDRGVPRVWLHRGIGRGAVSAAAVDLCRTAGVAVVDGACPLMFEEPVGGVHRMHRLLIRRRITGGTSRATGARSPQ